MKPNAKTANAKIYSVKLQNTEVGKLGYSMRSNNRLGKLQFIWLDVKEFPMGSKKRLRLYDRIKYAIEQGHDDVTVLIDLVPVQLVLVT